MKRVIVVAGMILWAMLLAAQTERPKVTQEIPKTCRERNLLRDERGEVVWLTHERMKARATKIVGPKMSGLLKRTARIEGHVIIGMIVGPDGKVRCSWVILGHPLLAVDALEAAKQWEFQPQMQKGNAVAFAGYLNFGFKMGYVY